MPSGTNSLALWLYQASLAIRLAWLWLLGRMGRGMGKQQGEAGRLSKWSAELGEGGGRRAKYEIKLWSHQPFASLGLLLCPSDGPLWTRNVTSPCFGGYTARFSVTDDNISLLQIAFNNKETYFLQAHQRLSLLLFKII